MAINPIGTLASKAAQLPVVGDVVRSMWSTVFMTVNVTGGIDVPVPLPGWCDVAINDGVDISALQAPGGWGQAVSPMCINASRIQLSFNINTMTEMASWLAILPFLKGEGNLKTSRMILHPVLVAAGITQVFINTIDVGPYKPATGGSINITLIEDTDIKFVENPNIVINKKLEDGNFVVDI